MKNFLTIDLEDYYQVTGFSDVVPLNEWDLYESRIERNVEFLLQAFEGIKATFFVLGYEAEKRPQLIKLIAENGHEIATHGRRHRLITDMNRKDFADDLKSAVELLEDLTGKKILGHRAPSFSIIEQTSWAYKVMAELGLKYDSSVFPTTRKRGGIERAEMKPYKINTGKNSLYEFPLAVVKVLGRKVPVAGGGFFRLYPYWVTKNAIRSCNSKGIPIVVYVHPWEFDPGQPHLKSMFNPDGFKHYINVNRNRDKFRKLLKDFEFIPIKDYFEAEIK